jgi:hypothetical protein
MLSIIFAILLQRPFSLEAKAKAKGLFSSSLWGKKKKLSEKTEGCFC